MSDNVALRDAAVAAVAAWDAYVEAHAGRGHDGPHIPEAGLDCGPCAGAQYGTEIEMSELVIPMLRRAVEPLPTADEVRGILRCDCGCNP